MVENSIVFYDWEKIVSDSKSNLIALKIIEDLSKTKNQFNKKYSGKSFLLKPQTLFDLPATLEEKAQVAQIASVRNYFDYWFNGYKDILMDFCDISEAKLNLNRLIKIDNRLIKLRHEG